MWPVEVDCPNVGDVEGYNWSFPAEVSSGFMSGLSLGDQFRDWT
jgi:hypothetical protein